MAAEKFNALKGFSVGIPAIDVIDSNGNIVTNVVVPSGNVTANKVYANHYYYANGTPFSSDPAGTNTEVQFNNNGVLGASANFTFNTTTQTVSVSNFSASGNLVNLGNVDNLQIDGGLNGYVLQTDGAGNLSWTAQTGNGGGGNGVPGGSNTQVQFNDAGAFGGDSGFIYDKDTNLLSVDYIGGDGSNLSNITYANITGIGNISSIDLDGNAQHVLYGNGVFAEIDTGTISNYANYAGNVTISAQPNITSVGTLTSVESTGEIKAVSFGTQRSNVAVSTNTVVDEFDPTDYRTAKYVFSASGDDGYQSVEVLLVHDGSDAYITIYGSVCSNTSADIVEFSSNVNGVSGNVTVYATTSSSNVNLNVVTDYILT